MEQSSFLKLVASYFKDTMRLFRFSLESRTALLKVYWAGKCSNVLLKFSSRSSTKNDRPNI
jgi:hypothetical protein